MFEYRIDDRFSLRMLRRQDGEELFQLVDANRQYLRRWLPWLDANRSPEETRAFIEATLDQYARNEGFVCAVVFDGKIIGTVGYQPIKWANKSVEIGYWLSEQYMGRGIITRCCRALIDYAFDGLGLNRVSIAVAEQHSKSRAIPQRLGFKKEGVIRDAEWLYDHYVDHVVYSLLRREWRSGGETGADSREKRWQGSQGQRL